MPNDRESAFQAADSMMAAAMRTVTAGVDPDQASETVAEALGALAKQAKALRAVEYQSEAVKRVKCECGATVEVPMPNAESLAKTMAQTAKMIDETARLTQFVSGKADSRTEVGLPLDILKALTDAQLQQVMGWVEANGRSSESV